MKETIFVASAGTGKTTRLLNELRGVLYDTPPERIIYTTFTNAGANEAMERAIQRFDYKEEQFQHFRTLHSICYRNIPRRQMLTIRDYFSLGKLLGYPISGKSLMSKHKGNTLVTGSGDFYLALDSLKRNRLGSTYEEICRGVISKAETPQKLQHFSETYKNFKESLGKIDFTDQLEMFLALDQPINAKYLFVDEAQDLSKLQWAVIDLLKRPVKKCFVAGDDKQAIYEFAGGDPGVLIGRRGTRIVLDKCFRLKPKLLEFAEKIADRITLKTPYTVAAVDKPDPESEVLPISSISHLDMTKESWFLLVRNWCYLEVFERMLIAKGLLFTSPSSQTVPKSLLAGIASWNRLLAGKRISVQEAQNLYKNYLPTGSRVQRGYKKTMEAAREDELFDYAVLRKKYGLLCNLPWYEALPIQPKMLTYLRSAMINGKLEDASRIEITTIHSTKGREADNVVVLPDMAWLTWNAYQDDPDTEHRTFYVACTRARKRLYLHKPIQDNFYKYPNI